MANGLQFIDGQLQFVGQGTDPFFDPSVPGAAQSNPQLDVTPQVNQQIIDEEQRSIEQAQTEQTEAQRLQAEQRKKEVRAQKAQLAEQKAALDAREAADEAGLQAPEPQAPEPQEAPAQQAPQGQELIDQGFEQRREGAAAEAGAEAGQLKEQAQNLELAAVEAQESFNVQRDAATAMKREQNRLADIDAAHQAEIETDVQRPSVSMLGLAGVFLNGLIAPMQGGRNTALEIVNRQLANEVDLELANRKSRIAGLEKQRGIALDKAELARGEAVQRELMHAKKLKAFREQLQGAVDSKFLPAQRKAQLQSLLGELDVQQGQHQQNASAKAAELAMRHEQLELRKAQAAAKARGGRGGGTKRVKLGEPGGPTAVWDPFARDIVNPTDLKQLKGKKAAGLGTATNLGVNIRTPRGTVDSAILKENQQKDIVKAINNRNIIRQHAQNARGALDALIEENGEGLGNVIDLKLDGLTGVGKGAIREVKQTIAQMTNEVKNQSGAGASLTDSELELIVNQAFGENPDKFLAAANIGEIREAIGRFQDSVSLQVRVKLAAELGVSPDDIEFKNADVTRSQRQRQAKQPAPTIEQAHERIGAITQAINEGDPDVSISDAKKQADLLVKAWRAGTTGQSAAGETGGVIAKGNEEFVLGAARDQATDPKLKAVYADAIKRIRTKPKKKSVLDLGKQEAKRRKISGKKRSLIEQARELAKKKK